MAKVLIQNIANFVMRRYNRTVLATQVGICFLIWIGFGYFTFKRCQKNPIYNGKSKSQRTALGTIILIGSAGGLLAGLLGLQAMGGIQHGSLTQLAWLAVAIMGSIFVGLQVLSIEILFGIVFENVTSSIAASSDPKEGKPE